MLSGLSGKPVLKQKVLGSAALAARSYSQVSGGHTWRQQHTLVQHTLVQHILVQHTLVVPALNRLRQKCCEFGATLCEAECQASQDYIVKCI